MTDTAEEKRNGFINPDREQRRESLRFFLAAAILLCGMYLSELFHLLEEPLFSRIFYGNINEVFFAACSSLYMIGFFIFFHHMSKKLLGCTPFVKREEKVGIGKTAILYAMTILPIIIWGIALNFRLKLTIELGERVTGMTLLSNGTMYANSAVKLLYAVYFIFLTEKGFRLLFTGGNYIPYGGIALLLTFGIIEFFLSASRFNWLYMILCVYYGVIWLVSERRYAITYCLALILFVI